MKRCALRNMVTVVTLWCVSLLAGCGDDGVAKTRVVVAIHSDLVPGTELSSVKLQTYYADGRGEAVDGATFKIARGLADNGKVRLPISQGIRKRRQSKFLLVVTGYGRLDGRPEGMVAQYKARLTFTEGKHVLHKVFLGRACKHQLCTPDTACYGLGEKGSSQGVCQDILDFEDLPELVPGEELAPVEAATAIDAGGEDGGGAAPPDGSYGTPAEDGGNARPDGSYATPDAAVVPADSSTDGSGSVLQPPACEADDSCPSCTAPTDCPAPENDCTEATCDSAGECVTAPKDANLRCAGGVCDGEGACVECLSESNCPSASPFCVDRTCHQCRGQSDCSESEYEACESGSCVVQPHCGDGEVNGVEVCDPTADGWNPWTCSEQCERTTLYTACDPADEDFECEGVCFAGTCLSLGCNKDSDCPAPPAGFNAQSGCRDSFCVPLCPFGENESCAPGLVCARIADDLSRCSPCGLHEQSACSPGTTCIPLTGTVNGMGHCE